MLLYLKKKNNKEHLILWFISVEGRNQDNLENSQSVHSQIQAINKTVQSYKKGTNGLDQIVKNLSDITNKVCSINYYLLFLYSKIVEILKNFVHHLEV